MHFKDLVDVDANSMEVHPGYLPLIEQLYNLKKQTTEIAHAFNEFRQEAMCDINKAMGKITSVMHKELSNKSKLQEELEIVKKSNAAMKSEVIQLREMIEQFVKSYNSEIEIRQTEIRELKQQLGIVSYEEKSKLEQIGELDIIQQVSEYTASVRGSSTNHSVKQSTFPMFSCDRNQQNEDEFKMTSKEMRAKSFIKTFQKNVDESVIAYQTEQLKNQSHSSSVEDLHLGDTDKINLPKEIKPPKNMQFIKKKTSRLIFDENKQNNDLKATPNHRRNKSSSLEKANKFQELPNKHCRSHSRTGSKQKIKLTSKIVDDSFVNKFGTVKAGCLRPSVHLGGKMYLKKLTKDIRKALQEYKIWEGTKEMEVRYEGQKKNGMRWGKGKLLYDCGFEYEGSFIQNYKHGLGQINQNGIIFYEGQWSLDELNGQGYIKSLKNYSQKCPKALSQASYCGQLMQNKPHGMGTLFVNQNQKFVTKFVHGVPVGEFTYYNHSEIQFGNWF